MADSVIPAVGLAFFACFLLAMPFSANKKSTLLIGAAFGLYGLGRWIGYSAFEIVSSTGFIIMMVCYIAAGLCLLKGLCDRVGVKPPVLQMAAVLFPTLWITFLSRGILETITVSLVSINIASGALLGLAAIRLTSSPHRSVADTLIVGTLALGAIALLAATAWTIFDEPFLAGAQFENSNHALRVQVLIPLIMGAIGITALIAVVKDCIQHSLQAKQI